ncbi:MAG: hypothetical protein ISR65_18860 [Bacteriovoracaceae bacterium]|nr:hypothetical protein [Bacteriovoracaceae bacterium]
MEELRLRPIFLNNKSYCRSLANTVVRAYPEDRHCTFCGLPTKILKTSKKTCYSFIIGKFTLIEGYAYCEEHKRAAIDSNEILKYRSLFATEIVEKGYKVTLDLMVKIGVLRYLHYRQLEEIKVFLKLQYLD